MKYPVAWALLFVTIRCATFYRLSSNEQAVLNSGDSLISTLGLFKLTLQ